MAGWRYPHSDVPESKLSLACLPTPLVLLERLSASLGTGQRVWIKRDDLTGCALSGNKVRKLEFTLADALQHGADTIITCGGVQSNHCRATAILGAQLGLKVHLILRGTPQEMQSLSGNVLLDLLCGAEIELHPAHHYNKNFKVLYNDALDRYRQAGSRPYWITTGASDAVGVWGYVAACEELRADFEKQRITNPHIVCASGSGGTQAGLVAGNILHELDATVWGINVCDDEAYFLRKIRDDLKAWKKKYRLSFAIDEWDINIIDGYVGEGYAKASDELLALIADVARLEGLILDPVYSGKAFYGMLSEIQRGRFADSKDIVFIHTGGIFGLQPYAGQLAKVLAG
ncbi:MAG TPA: D-cysteine desulfhydrase family protein [Pseudomonadales bacterium]|nr:D-cysteine desulfhydrase family protein [Pseudomonadales bacterium]